ncbi:hypothetical protein ACHAWF_013057 [Thalassiosira exigua]
MNSLMSHPATLRPEGAMKEPAKTTLYFPRISTPTRSPSSLSPRPRPLVLAKSPFDARPRHTRGAHKIDFHRRPLNLHRSKMKRSIYDLLSRDAESSAESLAATMRLERTTYSARDRCYLRAGRHSAITESDRTKIVDWCYNVVDHCKFDRETVASAMEIADRFLSADCDAAREASRDRKRFQLIVMASLYISIKTQEKVSLGSAFLSTLSHGAYTAEQIEAAELAVLAGLGWRICAPTAVQTAHRILSLLLPRVDLDERTWAFVLDEVRYQTEHAVRDYYFSIRRPSTVAIAAIFNTLDQVDDVRDRRALLRALTSVLSDEFDAPHVLRAARTRLLQLVGGDEAVSDEDSVASEIVREVEGASVNCSEAHRSTVATSKVSSPRSVSCCRR